MKFKVDNGHTLNEMALVGTFDGCDVCVYSSEDSIPHFHIKDIQANQECCIRIDKPEYSNHSFRYQMKLNKSDIKDLINWLSSPSRRAKKWFGVDITIYQDICSLWDQNNPDYELNEDIVMPDYTLLNN